MKFYTTQPHCNSLNQCFVRFYPEGICSLGVSLQVFRNSFLPFFSVSHSICHDLAQNYYSDYHNLTNESPLKLTPSLLYCNKISWNNFFFFRHREPCNLFISKELWLILVKINIRGQHVGAKGEYPAKADARLWCQGYAMLVVELKKVNIL